MARLNYRRFGYRSLGLGVVAGIAWAAAVAGCDGKALAEPCVCTEEFRSSIVTVVDGTGAPVEGLDVAVVRVRDGAILPVEQGAAIQSGTYVIFDDSLKDEVTVLGDAIQVIVAKDGVSAVANYVFATDDCRCHIEKVSGPDTVLWGVGT